MPTVRAVTTPWSQNGCHKVGGPRVMFRQEKQCLDRMSGLAVFCFAMRFLYRELRGRRSVSLQVGKGLIQCSMQNY